MKNFMVFAWSIGLISLIFYGLYRFFGDAFGLATLDWIIGLCSVIWLLFIITVPWNAYFKAREILDEAAISKRKDILVIEESLHYVKKVVKTSLTISIALHIISALVLYYIASSGISITGYYAAIVTLLFTFLRPAIRFYDYLQHKLNAIREEFRYPREDINTLLNDIAKIQQDMQFVLAQLSTEKGDDSWRNSLTRYCKKNDQSLQAIELALAEQKAQLAQEVNKLTEAHSNLVTKMVDNAQVLESVRVIARFFKGI